MKVMIGTFPALPNTATCNCAYGGTIQITFPGQTKVMVN
jgi:hypothetical protein